MSIRAVPWMVAVGVVLTGPSLALAGVRAAPPHRATLATFAGRWTGHTRFLRIRRGGRATEVIYSGCCNAELNLTLRLSRPNGTSTDASAHALITGVWVRDRAAFNARHPAPRLGATGRLLLKHAVIYEPFTHTNYCSVGGSKCGA